MEIFPFVGVSELSFSDNTQSIKEKLAQYGNIHEGVKAEMSKEFPSYFVQELDLYIVFFEKGNAVRYFEVGSDTYHMNKNLNREPLAYLKEFYQKKDGGITILDDGFDSPMFGIRVTENDNAKNLVLVYSKEYASEPEISEDDIISYFLK